ncbi:hypothetical protein A2397_05835 [Candidatus Amesbacteria bacterium RIFOXYB1_FULL_44_23]|uniref:Uncharacterized protein n=1 Tax=Candidatus Amesbacteria bacterium RIFOXYB1_FULL_44_23 TaxID=1797263 RepID=A0A1F4ZT41_9BACT|nr:MAG: hypothetical protein A2397_05835 [Candidatus Amesbacteria bacterium RIFOXYB1_FULL_44_23]
MHCLCLIPLGFLINFSLAIFFSPSCFRKSGYISLGELQFLSVHERSDWKITLLIPWSGQKLFVYPRTG